MHNYFPISTLYQNSFQMILSSTVQFMLIFIIRESGCNKKQHDGCVFYFFFFSILFLFIIQKIILITHRYTFSFICFFFYFAEPITSIIGEPEMFIDKDSTMNLTCVVRHSPEPPTAIYWTHDHEVLNF